MVKVSLQCFADHKETPNLSPPGHIRYDLPKIKINGFQMAAYQELHRYLLRLVILPVAIVCAIVAITYFYLHSSERDHALDDHTHFLSDLLADAPALLNSEPEKLDRLAESVLAIDSHRALVLRNESDVLKTWGKPHPLLLESRLDAHALERNKSYLFLTLTLHHSSTVAIVQVENYQSQLYTQRAITGVILATALCLFVLLYFVRQFDAVLTTPLSTIQAGIRQFLSGEYSTPIKIHQGSVFEELVKLLNSLASSHKEQQENYQENVEQTIIDLKETLETVEIQNIELDLERKNAVQANRAKSEFLSNTSHELKTPLNSIMGYAELLDKSALNKHQGEYLQAITEAAKSLSTTINDILDYSRLEIGTLTLEHKPVNVRELLEDVIQQLSAAATRQGIRLLAIVDHDVPDNLLGDPQRLKQVLLNLTSNAVKFTPEGYVLINISNEMISDERYTLRFKVTDSGVGMSTHKQDSLFDSAARSLQDNRSTGGTGLGLIIAKGLVERMNGQIEVESAEGKGATFWFTATFALNLAVRNTQENRISSLSDLRAVVYESNTMSRMELGHYLSSWGVETAESTKAGELSRLCEQFLHAGDKNLIVIDIESLKQELLADNIIDYVKKLSTEFEAFCILVYGLDEHKLFQQDKKSAFILELDKPILYNNLYLALCNRFGIFSPRLIANTDDDQVTPPTRTINILAVDDNFANLKLVKELLKDKGIEADLAESGQQALAFIADKKYDLILMDVQMPEMDGMATTMKIREQETETRIPIVALTAHAANEKKMALLIAGMDDYISKPINSSDLDHILNRWIDNANLQQLVEYAAQTENQDFIADKHIHDDLLESGKPAPVSLKLSMEKSQNKPDLARDMLQMLLESLEESKTRIQHFWNQGDVNNIQEVVHKLHGGCCYCGVPELTEICSKIDKNLQDGKLSSLEKDLSVLYQKMDELTQWSEEIELGELFGTE